MYRNTKYLELIIYHVYFHSIVSFFLWKVCYLLIPFKWQNLFIEKDNLGNHLTKHNSNIDLSISEHVEWNVRFSQNFCSEHKWKHLRWMLVIHPRRYAKISKNLQLLYRLELHFKRQQLACEVQLQRIQILLNQIMLVKFSWIERSKNYFKTFWNRFVGLVKWHLNLLYRIKTNWICKKKIVFWIPLNCTSPWSVVLSAWQVI